MRLEQSQQKHMGCHIPVWSSLAHCCWLSSRRCVRVLMTAALSTWSSSLWRSSSRTVSRSRRPASAWQTHTHTHSETAGLHCPLLKGVNLRSGIIHIYMYLTCSFRLCDCASSFCWRVSSLASYCSRMAVTSLSCCSRARVRVSERHRSIICSFMLSIAASATCCCFRLCVRTHFLSYKRLHHVLRHFNKLQMHNLTWTCCVTDAWGIHELVPLALGLWETGSVSPEIWFSPAAALLSLSPPPLVHWTPSVIQSDRLSHLDKKQQILWLKLVLVLYYLIYIYPFTFWVSFQNIKIVFLCITGAQTIELINTSNSNVDELLNKQIIINEL